MCACIFVYYACMCNDCVINYVATEETVLLYGWMAWTLTQSLDKKDGRGIYKNAESGEECDLVEAHYK